MGGKLLHGGKKFRTGLAEGGARERRFKRAGGKDFEILPAGLGM